MKYMLTYDLMETARNTNQWLGATAKALAGYPATGLVANPMLQMMGAWGEVTERSFERMVAKPDWGIDSVTAADGRDHIVDVQTVVPRPFGDLVKFDVQGRPAMDRRILIVAPMSGHYATLLRSTVRSLLPDADLWITDWHNARDIPVSAGKFDVEDYTLYLADFMKELGPETHVIAVCQPVPLALAATALLASRDPAAQPASLTLIGGPVDPDAAPTEVTDFGARVTMGQLEQTMIQRVGFKYAGAGRMVYPGLLQLSSFIAMNAGSHAQSFFDQTMRVAKGESGEHDRHNRFYDEYLAVMDMTAEFYLSTVDRIFKNREIAQNEFYVEGEHCDLTKITSVAVKIVEGEKDDISAPGQCLAALDLLTGVPADRKAAHLEPGAGHYGIFAGRSWRDNIRPLVLDFVDRNGRAAREAEAEAAADKARAAEEAKAAETRAKAAETRAAKAAAAAKAKADADADAKREAEAKAEREADEAKAAETARIAKEAAAKAAADKARAASAARAAAKAPAPSEAVSAKAAEPVTAPAEAPKANGATQPAPAASASPAKPRTAKGAATRANGAKAGKSARRTPRAARKGPTPV